MNEHGLPVVDEAKCTACGDCVEACPKDLFSLHPASHRLWVACKSLEAGDELLDDCEVACTACGRCAMDAPGPDHDARTTCPVVDYDRNHETQGTDPALPHRGDRLDRSDDRAGQGPGRQEDHSQRARSRDMRREH